MPELTPDIHKLIREQVDAGRRFAMAVVLKTEGSTPRQAGARAVFTSDGDILGTIGGGPVEAEAHRLALAAIESGKSMVFIFEFKGDAIEGMEPVCGGTMQILIDADPARHENAFVEAAAARAGRQRGFLLTTIRCAEGLQVDIRFADEPALAGEPEWLCADFFRAGSRQELPQFYTCPDTGAEVFVEPLHPGPLVLLLGGGHVGQAVAKQAVEVGFEVLVLDDRPEFTDPRLYPPGVGTCCGDFASELSQFRFDKDTYVVIVTRGHLHDTIVLESCLKKPAGYIGMIGSRRKVGMMRQSFIQSGQATAEEFDRVYAPIGLDIGATTVPEIATSIVAQLISVRRKSTRKV